MKKKYEIFYLFKKPSTGICRIAQTVNYVNYGSGIFCIKIICKREIKKVWDGIVFSEQEIVIGEAHSY